jgi:hypothetical protein
MKVQAETIVEFLDQVKSLVEGISYTIKCGDDGFEEAVSDQVETISKVIEVFKLEQLTPVTPIEPTSKKYGRLYELLCDKEDRSQGDNIQLYKSQLYFVLKRVIKDYQGIADCPNNELFNVIEAAIPDNSIYKKMIYSNEFYYCSQDVIKEVVDEIIGQRKKAPQTKLFQ